MSRETVNVICGALPGAENSDPWGGGHDCWKVGGKMFAVMGAISEGVSVKTADVETAEMLIEAGAARKAPYMHKSWVNLSWGLPDDEIRERVVASYRLIRAALPKKVQAGLAPV